MSEFPAVALFYCDNLKFHVVAQTQAQEVSQKYIGACSTQTNEGKST